MSEPMNELLWLGLSALAAGTINSVAGGGTLLTFPALLAALNPLGVEAGRMANTTSTAATNANNATNANLVRHFALHAVLHQCKLRWSAGGETAPFAAEEKAELRDASLRVLELCVG